MVLSSKLYFATLGKPTWKDDTTTVSPNENLNATYRAIKRHLSTITFADQELKTREDIRTIISNEIFSPKLWLTSRKIYGYCTKACFVA